MRQSAHAEDDKKIIGIGVIGWDAASERMTEQVFFNDGDCVLLRWKVVSSNEMVGEVAGIEQGQPVKSKASFKRIGKDEFLYESKTPDGEEVEVVARRVTRKQPSKQTTGVPKAALREMKYRVGKWVSIGYVDGTKVDELGHEVAQWNPGEYSIRIHANWVEDGARMNGTAIVGWDAVNDQLVEQWYTDDGGYMTFRYDLDKKPNCWTGTFVWVTGDGELQKGKSVVEKKNRDEWEWNASYSEDGEKHTMRTTNRRVK